MLWICRRKPTSISRSKTTAARSRRCREPNCGRSRRSGAIAPAIAHKTRPTPNSLMRLSANCSRGDPVRRPAALCRLPDPTAPRIVPLTDYGLAVAKPCMSLDQDWPERTIRHRHLGCLFGVGSAKRNDVPARSALPSFGTATANGGLQQATALSAVRRQHRARRRAVAPAAARPERSAARLALAVDRHRGAARRRRDHRLVPGPALGQYRGRQRHHRDGSAAPFRRRASCRSGPERPCWSRNRRPGCRDIGAERRPERPSSGRVRARCQAPAAERRSRPRCET